MSELRHRTGASGGCGKVKIGLVFDAKREELKVTIYEAKGLPGGDLPGVSVIKKISFVTDDEVQ